MKKLLVAALAVALTAGAAAAQTTMTLNGYIKVIPDVSNAPLKGPVTPSKDANTKYLVDQRTRMFFNLKSGENVGGTVSFEIDTQWGVAGSAPFDSDQKIVELKDAFLWFKPTDALKITAGVVNFSDNFSGVLFWGADFGAALASYDLSKDSNLTIGLGDLAESNAAVVTAAPTTTRNATTWLMPVLFKTKVGEGSAGVDFYLLRANNGNFPDAVVGEADVKYLGAYYNGVAGKMKYNLWGFYNWGEVNKQVVGPGVAPDVVRAIAAQAMVDAKVGSGNLRARGLYVQGGDGANNALADKYNSIVVYGASIALATNDLLLLMKSVEDVNTIRSLNAMDVRQGGYGTILYYLAYDMNTSEKGNIKFVAGHLGTDKADAKGQRELGEELNAQYTYKFSKELTLGTGFGYAFLNHKHSAYDAGEENVWRLVARASYAF